MKLDNLDLDMDLGDMSVRLRAIMITIMMAVTIISVCAVCGCIQDGSGITGDEALLIALNDSALTNVTGGSDPGEYESEVTVGDDGKTVYTFHFSPYPSRGYGLLQYITITVGSSGEVIDRKVSHGPMITPSNPEMYAPEVPADVAGKGALNTKLYPGISFRRDGLDVKLKSAEFTDKSSEFYFVAHAMFIKEVATPQNKSNMPPGPILNGNISVSGRDIEEFDRFNSVRWDGDAIGFKIRSGPVPADTENVSVSIGRIYGRDFNRNYEVI